MATYTVTSSINIDALVAKTGSDTYNINGGYLTVDQDSRFGANQSVSASMGNITISATLGGTIEFNAQSVRIIPYNSGSGNVPPGNTPISGSTGSGRLISVMSALSGSPILSGSAMPATGFIKIKQWNSSSFGDAEVLTGISGSVSGSDRVGWLEIVGVDALTATCNRLGTFKVRGEWLDLGTTDGIRSSSYQIPSHGAIVYRPGVWVETAVTSSAYEFYPCAGTTTALSGNIATDEVRGRWCWISTAGLLRFGADGTNSSGGFIPEAGRKIRIPNIFFSNCTAAAPAVNVLPNATLATRYEFATTGGGVLDIDKACFNWYLNLNQPYSLTLSNVGVLTTLVATEIASPITWTNVGVGHEAAVSTFGLSMSLCFAGGTMTNCTWTRATMTASGHYIKTWTDMSGFTVTGERLHSLEDIRGNASTGAATMTRVASCNFTSCLVGGGRVLMTTCTQCTFTNSIYYDHPATTTIVTIPQYAFDLASNCTGIKVDGLSFGGLTLCQPYSGIMNIAAAGCSNIKLRNLGTYASPLDLGDARQDVVSWTRVTTTATVTKTAHGLKTGDIVYVPVSSVTAAIIVGSKTVTSTPTANTFTFACLNAGAASGTLSYFPTMSANLFVLAASAAANDIEVKRCYTPHTRTNLYTADNSSKNIRLENVYSDFLNAFTMPQLNGTFRAVTGTPTLAAQTSVYGTHWWGNFIAEVAPNITGISWTRATTTATVTSNDHGLRTGLQLNVLVSSDTAAITLGTKTVTVVDANTFTFTCLNAGAASGTLTMNTFISRIGLMMNEATADTAGVYTIDVGTPAFTSAGGLYMPVIGDQITFTHPDYVLGHTEFQIAEAVMAGGTLTNYDVTYAIDKNDDNGFSAFRNLSHRRAGAGGTSGLTTVTMTDTTGVAVDDYVFGTNVAPLAKVVSIDSGTNITVSIANTGTVSGILRFNQLPNEAAIDPSLGIMLKIRFTTAVTNATAITSFYVFTDSTVVSRGYEYPLDLGVLTLTGLRNPTEVRVFNAGTTTEIAGTGQETVTSGTFTAQIDVSTYPSVDISILSLGYQNTRLLAVAIPADGVSIPVQQQIDRQYLNP